MTEPTKGKLEDFHRITKHVDNLFRIQDREGRREYLENLEKTEGKDEADKVRWHFGYRWNSAKADANG